MTLRLTILGCGSSGGVPRPGGPDGRGDWGVCDPSNPKNIRTRSSVLLDQIGPLGTTRVVIDTAPDLRTQLLAAKVDHIDAVVFTHDHADQTHGIDDVRPLYYAHGSVPIPCYWNAPTRDTLLPRFAYAFMGARGYPPIYDARMLPDPGVAFAIDGPGGVMRLIAIDQDHGGSVSLGFRCGDIAYSNDVVELDDRAFDLLAGVKLWVVDCLRYKPHPTHAHLEKTLSWIARLKPERAVLSNLHIDLDYETLRRELPSWVEPAYDGMVLTA
jgi:phosphoribosyl 1,2-cyclic phosphate phosphodiesterase